jgi:hypothetical protein
VFLLRNRGVNKRSRKLHRENERNRFGKSRDVKEAMSACLTEVVLVRSLVLSHAAIHRFVKPIADDAADSMGRKRGNCGSR